MRINTHYFNQININKIKYNYRIQRYFNTNIIQYNEINKESLNNKVNEDGTTKMKQVEKLKQRFWKAAELVQNEDQFIIKLDGRSIKTPFGNILSIPNSKKTLAYLIAGEWEAQETTIKPHSLPLTSLAARALDTFKDVEGRVQCIDNLMKYLETDSICYRQPHPEKLVQLQNEFYQPILDFIQKKYKVDIKFTEGILPIEQTVDTLKKLKEAAYEFDALRLAGFERATISSKSYLIGLALMHNAITVEQAAKAAHVEVGYQIERWGEVEDSHDVDHAELRKMLGSAALTTFKD